MGKYLRSTLGVALILLLSLASFTQVLASPSQQAVFQAPILVVNTSFLNIRTGPSAQFAVLTTVTGGTELPVLGTAGDRVWYQVSTPVGVGWVNIEFAIPRGDFTNVPLVRVTEPPVQPLIIEAGGVGNIALPQVSAGQTTGVPNAAQPMMAVASGPVFRAFPREAVAVYSQPGATGGALTTLQSNDQTVDYAIINRASVGAVDYIALDIPGFGVGWVEAAKIQTRLGRTTSRDVVVISASVVALTVGPGGGNDGLLPIVTEGTEGYLLDISADSNFVKIELANGAQGWVPFSTVRSRTGTTTDITPLQAGTTMAMPAAGAVAPANADLAALGQGGGGSIEAFTAPRLQQNRVVINTSFLNVRTGPGAQYTALLTARGGAEYGVIGLASDGVWFLVQTPSGQGWVNNEFVIFRGDIESVPIIRNASGVLSTPIAAIGSSVQLYAAPGTNFGLLGSIAGPVEAPIVARNADFTWVQINTSVGFGWVLANQITIRGEASLIPVVAN